MEEPYEVVLKTYQLKEIFLSADISLTVHECEKLLKSGFCQPVSRLIRKYLNTLTDCRENKEIDITLLGITHKYLLSESDSFQRRAPLIEIFTCNDLISFANTGLYIIEYIASILCLSAKIDSINPRYREQIKEELSGLTVFKSIESLLVIDIFLNEELRKELNLLSTRSSVPFKEPLSSWTHHLLKIIETKIIYMPEGLRHVDCLIDKFIKSPADMNILLIDILLQDIRHNELNILKSLQHILMPCLDVLIKDSLKEDDKLTVLLFNYVHVSLHLLSISLEEVENFFHRGNLYNLITAIQLLSICSSAMTLMIDRRELLFQTEDMKIITNKFINYFTGKCDKEDLLELIEEEVNNIYLKQEIEGNITYEHIIRDYKKSIELLGKEPHNFRSLPLFLKAHNRLLTCS